MTILSQVLPGLRDLRAPLAAGVLWVLVALVFSDLLPSELLHGELAQRVAATAENAPQALAIPLGVLGLYLLGVVFTEIAGIVVGLIWGSLGYITITFIFYLFFRLLFAEPIRVGVIALAAHVILYVTWRQNREKYEESFFNYVVDMYYFAADKIYEFLVEAGQAAIRIWNPTPKLLESFLEDELERLAGATPGLVSDLVNEIPDNELGRLASTLGLRIVDLRAHGPELETLRRTTSIRRVLRRARRDKKLSEVIRRAIHARVNAEPKLRKSFLSSTHIDSSALKEELRKRLDSADVQLRAQHPELYSEYDRLRAEAEFRASVAVPFSLLIAGLTRLAINDLGIPSDELVEPYIPAIVVGILMAVASDGKSKAASDLLYASLRQQIIKNVDSHIYGPGYIRVRRSRKYATASSPSSVQLGEVLRGLARQLKRKRVRQSHDEHSELPSSSAPDTDR
ncbi:MAG TPA: hypothetical protein VIL34_17630 [Actinopolymorphaceae bacterium]